jgi:ABC-type uncharacterized transport system auxiliary subunit
MLFRLSKYGLTRKPFAPIVVASIINGCVPRAEHMTTFAFGSKRTISVRASIPVTFGIVISNNTMSGEKMYLPKEEELQMK